ncbi:DoxX family protein [Corynebacterium sputi]|uniref:DoxX family protein n=1 Tax=Corynebacterium sputi TaxID=489915 RepID=UPI00047DE405|nr:DoxX family protein [Corynebacterium sputi]
MDRPAVRDGALLFLRLVIGAVFVAHGWDKIFLTGVPETAAQFAEMGIPQAQMTVWLVAIVEIIAGALLILGLLGPFVAGVLIVEMFAALWFVHINNGLFVSDGGFEYALVMIAALSIVVTFGSGRASLDRVFTR